MPDKNQPIDPQERRGADFAGIHHLASIVAKSWFCQQPADLGSQAADINPAAAYL